MVAGNYRDALKSIQAVRQLRIAKGDSEAEDRSKRELFKPGKRQQIDFRSERLVSRKLTHDVLL